MTIYPSDHKLTMQERKACTEAFLHSMGIKTLATLPFIEDYIQARFRTPQTIARRALILIVLIDVAAGLITEQDALAYLKKYKLGKFVSPNEMRFLENPKREPKETNSMSWRAENINVLVWSLGYPLQLPFPTFTCSYDFDDHLPGYDEDPSDWIKSARLRNVEEILNELDLTYRMCNLPQNLDSLKVAFLYI
jgi:hypothetical protein